MASNGKCGKFKVVIADPPWKFADGLTMSKTKRGAASNYVVLTSHVLSKIPVHSWCADDAVLALWTPASMLKDGLHVLESWRFEHKQVVVWSKVNEKTGKQAFGMGRQFRNCCELVLIGTRGSPVPVSKSERNLFMGPALGHSTKPLDLHVSLERMYPGGPFLELFARRAILNWTCVGLECGDGVKADLRTWTPG